MSFERALNIVLKHEGGYVNHRLDKGGPTKQGVTQSTYDSWRRSNNLPVREVKLIDGHEVAEVYRSVYWTPAKCDELPSKLAIVMFDLAVNSGVRKSVIVLQRVLGISDDGVFGPKTKAALTKTLQTLGEDWIVSSYLDEREDFYLDIVRTHPSQGVFLKGWQNRVDSLRTEVRQV